MSLCRTSRYSIWVKKSDWERTLYFTRSVALRNILPRKPLFSWNWKQVQRIVQAWGEVRVTSKLSTLLENEPMQVFWLVSHFSCQFNFMPKMVMCVKKNTHMTIFSLFMHFQIIACMSCQKPPQGQKKEEELRSEAALTDSGDNSPGKEKGGTDVPEARLIGWISWRVHTCSDCWNHLLERQVKKKKKKKLADKAPSPRGSVVWGGLRNVRKFAVCISFLRGTDSSQDKHPTKTN